MRKQAPRTNWEITISPADAPPITLKRRLTTMSYLDWLDDVILTTPYPAVITVYAITETSERRHITTTSGGSFR